MAKEKKLTVRDLFELVIDFRKQGKITLDTEIWLSSDEEGNSYSPLMCFKNGVYNVSAEKDKLTLYPSSMHSEY